MTKEDKHVYSFFKNPNKKQQPAPQAMTSGGPEQNNIFFNFSFFEDIDSHHRHPIPRFGCWLNAA